MPDIKKLDSEAQRYFQTLPKNIQESILMSDVNVTNKQDLERIYNNLTHTNSHNSANQ